MTTQQRQYEPELGQICFGNAYAEYDLGDERWYVANKLRELSELIGGDNYGKEFKNKTFEMHPYYWGDCTCGSESHNEQCPIVIPNFRCGDVEIRWYKYIGRGMSINRPVSRKHLRKVFRKCRKSLHS